ncbi:hypothetical protein [Candidatus Uabimicrobium sp. HlEnr_7]|uniref:hypothetical protein n=1 Tax=Candidatus Uabimicrobium helgolandensis TaxID=3095367 RepID=UPI0035565ED4
MSSKAKPKKKKVDPVIDLLTKVETFGSYVVCAPKKLADKIDAYKYTASGKLTATDKLRKENVFKYLSLLRTEKYIIEGKKNKNGKAKTTEYIVSLYELSEKGKEVLDICRFEEEQKKKEELQSIEGTKSLLADHNEQNEKILQVIDELPNKQANLKSSFTEEMKYLQNDMQQQVNHCHKTIHGILNEIPKEQQKIHNAFVKDIEKIETKFSTQMTMFTKNIESKLEKVIGQVADFQNEFNKQVKDSISQSMESKVKQLQIINNELPSCIAEYKRENNFLSRAIDDYVAQEKQKVLSKYSESNPSNDFSAMESQIWKLLLPLINQEYVTIPYLYNEMKKQGVDISPGYFNDILLSLELKDQIVLGDWNHTQQFTTDYQHIIYRKRLYFYVKKGERS